MTDSTALLHPQTPARITPQAERERKAVIDTLNGLIDTCADGAYGFASCGDYANIGRYRALFRQRARECEEAQAQLHALVLRLGGQPARGGSFGGTLHRGWVAVRGSLSGLRDQSILAECERGETVALSRYRSALQRALPAEAHALVQRQADGIAGNLAQIRLLRAEDRASALPTARQDTFLHPDAQPTEGSKPAALLQ